jgi:hypothetical protein
LIDTQDMNLTDEISEKALVSPVRSIGFAEGEEAAQAMAAKSRAYFKRAYALRPKRPHDSVKLPLLSEIRWQARHEQDLG